MKALQRPSTSCTCNPALSPLLTCNAIRPNRDQSLISALRIMTTKKLVKVPDAIRKRKTVTYTEASLMSFFDQVCCFRVQEAYVQNMFHCT